MSCGAIGQASSPISDDIPVTPPEDNSKTAQIFTIGEPGEAEVRVTETPGGQLFFSLQPTYTGDSPADIDGTLFNLSDDSKLAGLIFSSAENSGASVTDI
ncbi:hypothetical protein ACFSUD_05760 [Sulfitobacter aestuarii]|uniref:Uncharacterized protein n=1 Tax=Sulfitobacter aestuarii TaxID=2161676 RepID=A0ABW5U1A8_9RHOB